MASEPMRSSEQPPAVGYIRVDEPADGEISNHLREIAVCCLRERLRLVRSFCDQGYDGSQLARPGIVELREALKETPGLVVVVPSLDHLAPAESIRGPLLIMIHRLGGRLVTAVDRDSS